MRAEKPLQTELHSFGMPSQLRSPISLWIIHRIAVIRRFSLIQPYLDRIWKSSRSHLQAVHRLQESTRPNSSQIPNALSAYPDPATFFRLQNYIPDAIRIFPPGSDYTFCSDYILSDYTLRQHTGGLVYDIDATRSAFLSLCELIISDGLSSAASTPIFCN